MVDQGDIAVIGALPTAREVLAAHINAQTSPATKTAYKGDLALFLDWAATAPDPAGHQGPAHLVVAREDILGHVLTLRRGQMVVLLNQYKAYMVGHPFAPATINRRLAAVKSVLQAAFDAELTTADPHGLVKGVKSARYRDTRGPTLDEVKRIMAAVDRSTLEGKRDYALLRFLWENALRRFEIWHCNIEDFDAKNGRLRIVRKGHAGEPVKVSLTKTVVKAVEEYIEARTQGARLDNGEPLFENHSNAKRNGTAEDRRLRGGGVYHICAKYSMAALGRVVSPHKWRHAATTTIINETGDERKAQDLGAWVDKRVMERYIDNARNGQAAASETLSKLA